MFRRQLHRCNSTVTCIDAQGTTIAWLVDCWMKESLLTDLLVLVLLPAVILNSSERMTQDPENYGREHKM